MSISTAAVLVATFAFQAGAAAPAERPNEPEEMVRDFLETLKTGDTETAFQGLLTDSPLLQQGNSIQMLISQTKAQLPLFGDVLRYEELRTKEVSPSLKSIKYLMLLEKDAMTWSFVFYKPRDRWIVTALRWLPSTEYLQ